MVVGGEALGGAGGDELGEDRNGGADGDGGDLPVGYDTLLCPGRWGDIVKVVGGGGSCVGLKKIHGESWDEVEDDD